MNIEEVFKAVQEYGQHHLGTPFGEDYGSVGNELGRCETFQVLLSQMMTAAMLAKILLPDRDQITERGGKAIISEIAANSGFRDLAARMFYVGCRYGKVLREAELQKLTGQGAEGEAH